MLLNIDRLKLMPFWIFSPAKKMHIVLCYKGVNLQQQNKLQNHKKLRIYVKINK